MFWLPLAPATDARRCKLIEAYNREAEKIFADEEVYMVPFVYDNANEVLKDFMAKGELSFNAEELDSLSASLAQAVQSFGAI